MQTQIQLDDISGNYITTTATKCTTYRHKMHVCYFDFW